MELATTMTNNRDGRNRSYFFRNDGDDEMKGSEEPHGQSHFGNDD